MKYNKINSHKIRLSRTQKNLLWVVLGISIIVQVISLSYYRKIQREKTLSTAQIYGESVATGISLALSQSISTSQVLKNLYVEYGEVLLDHFDRICERLVIDNPTISSMYIAPDAVIKTAYPKEIAASTIGFEMLKDPEQSEKTLLAINSKSIAVAGPHKLVEGGSGFIIRNPIFKDDEFDAFTIIVLDWDSFVKQILFYVDSEGSGYNFAVWKDNDDYAVTDEFGNIFKNCTSNVSRLVDIRIPVPNDYWHLSVEPVKGWNARGNIIIPYIISLLLMGTLYILVYFRLLGTAKSFYLVQHDELTGLLLRNAFLSRVSSLLKNNPNVRYNIIAADIDNFKVTNAVYGNGKGDEILKYLSVRYREITKQGLCARYGGDQYLMICPAKNPEQDFAELENFAVSVAEQAPIRNLNVKYGFYGAVDNSLPANTLCDRALLAARSILHNYEQTVANYEGPVSRQNMKEQILESLFETAIKNEDFKVWFQPKFDAFSEEIVGAEALVRWIKNDGTIVSPVDFIHVFEEDGLIYKLDLFVFEKVCRQLKYWLSKGYDIVPISVNVSRTTLQHKDVIKEYEEIVRRVGVPTEFVPLEITESSSSVSQRIKQLTEDLKKAGFKIHMDDFGTGVSSLESLNMLPFDVIKLDKSLIDFIGTPGGNELLRHTIELAQFMEMKIIAEGVENLEQLEFLRKLKCDHIQGYYFSAPMSYEDFIDYLKEKYYK